MFVLSLKSGTEEPTKNSFDDYYMPTIKVKKFNVLTDHKSFFDQPVKSKHETSRRKLVETPGNNDYATMMEPQCTLCLKLIFRQIKRIRII